MSVSELPPKQTRQRQSHWSCLLCTGRSFKSSRDFNRHLREYHCTKEGGSFVCRYGPNGVCPSLPLEGVSDKDYMDHVIKDHITAADNIDSRNSPSKHGSREGSPPPAQAGPSVVQDQHKWTVFSSQVNLPAALNDPRLGRQLDFFSKTWGEGFEKVSIYPSPHLEEITANSFKKYLDKTGKRLRWHTRYMMEPHTKPSNTEDFPSSIHRPREPPKSSELENIPKMFMEGNFSLENPATFNKVFPWTQIEAAKQDSSGKPQASSKLLQEKLSHYLDVIEVQIARQIAQRSEAFFHAMSSHDALQEYLSQTCSSIKHLRDKIHNLDSTLVSGPMRIMKLVRSRNNYIQVYNKLKMVATVHQTQPTIQLLLSTSEFVGALDLISTTQEVLQQELAGIHSFRHLGSQLVELEKVIDRMMQEDFLRYASAELNRPLSEPGCMEEERLVAIVMGMLRQHKMDFVEVYREEAATTLKAIMKQTVIEAVSVVDDATVDGNVNSLGDQIRLLDYQSWMDLLDQVFKNLLVILNRVKTVSQVIQEVAQLASGQPRSPNSKQQNQSQEPPPQISIAMVNDVDPMISQAECVKLTASLREMVCSVCDCAHDRCVKLLTSRGKDGFLEKLSSTEFVALSQAIEGFVKDCEQLCGRFSTSLRGSLQSQSNKFVNRFHEERKHKLSLILDNERWKQADVPAEFQDLVDNISQTGVLGIPEKKPDRDRKPSEYLCVNGQKYAVIGTVLILLNMVVEYCQCVTDIPTITQDILTRLVELLKMFNSRTCQLILGAGILKLGGLKTINTRHLALASRCLQLVVHFLPMVQAHFESRLLEKQSHIIKHFQHVNKDYHDHIAEIDNKLVSIMEKMFENSLSKWEVKAPMPSACFRGIFKQTKKFHEACVDLLPEGHIRELFKRLTECFKDQVSHQLVRLGLTNDGGPQHGLITADLAFFVGSLRSLPGLDKLPDNMDSIWGGR